ncbi:WD40 repeat domain-containing protein [Pontibacter korlensis]|uniref:WD40 repeat domain-containing protein n=1 Tax=Pontibacter korlensis TaxID=400092 RepID=UPI000698C333|nr:WD40 repeat domain-containing protein [Pontibacter korlensis]
MKKHVLLYGLGLVLCSFPLWGQVEQTAHTATEPKARNSALDKEAAAEAKPGVGKFTDLGPQVGAAAIQGSVFAKDDQGREMAYTVVRGEPAHLLGYDVQTNKLVVDLPLEKTDGVWDLAVSTDGWLYVPSASGYLFKHRPGTQQIENLGYTLPGETYLWDLAAGKDGEIFGATYPGCRVFRYHPKDGFSDVGKGPMVGGEKYVRSLVYHEKTGKIYAGVGSHAHLVELDPRTGKKTEFLPPEFKDHEFVYNMSLLAGMKGGDRLLALLTSGSENKSLVINLNTKKVEQVLGALDVRSALLSPDKKLVYYTSKGKLYTLNLAKPAEQVKEVMSTAGAITMNWSSEQGLSMITSGREIVRYNPATGKSTVAKLTVPELPIAIQSILSGPDGRIWTAGYVAGGHGVFDPATGKTITLKGLDQTEGMAVQGHLIFFGIYPHGRLYVYDTQKPWDMTKQNPKLIQQVQGQSRPFAVASAATKGTMFFGMVPEYGLLGGSLLEYDPGTDKLRDYKAVVKNQSIVALCHQENMIFGGTSVWGGIGAHPTEKEGKLFVWDATSGKKVLEMVPVPGAKAVTCLKVAPDGKLWGVAGGTLFTYSIEENKVLTRHQLYLISEERANNFVWRDAFLVMHPNGMVYGTANDELFVIDPETMEVKKLEENASLLTLGRDNRLYFRRGTHLWSYEP